MKNPLRKLGFHCFPALLSSALHARGRGSCALLGALLALLAAFSVHAAETAPASIPFSELGAKATADYHGGAIGIEASAGGARLRTAFQKLIGTVTSEGLCIESTEDGGGRLHLVATAVGRGRPSSKSGSPGTPLARAGAVAVGEKTAALIRPGLIEEYSVSVDGVRQDFVIAARPAGMGDLRVELALRGARAEAVAAGVKLTLEGSGRVLAYSRLRVVDATGRGLAATLEVLAADRLAVFVHDGDASFPVRIDPTFSDADWVSLNPGIPGASAAMRAIAVDGSGNVYIGGSSFTVAGSVAASRIAKWNGSAWSALGSGMNNEVFALAVSGGVLYAGGNFTSAGGVAVNRIAKWNGSSWSALGSGISGDTFTFVSALAVNGSDLYVGGNFTSAGEVAATGIAKWDGSTWAALGSGIGGVYALAVSGGDLYAGGQFFAPIAGTVYARNIAKWDGSAWSALGSGVAGNGVTEVVNALAVSGGNLYAGGTFDTAGGVVANNIAKWNGSAWSVLGAGVDGAVGALAASGSELYVGGSFATAGGAPVNRIAKWNGSAWSAVGSGVSGGVNGSGVSALGVSGGGVYVGGDFSLAGNAGVQSIARWDGGIWSALGPAGFNAQVRALAVAGSDLYAAGEFITVGGATVNRIAKWNGSMWSALGAGMNGTVRALAVRGGDLYAGGSFTEAGGIAANRIAKWDGVAWSALGTGLDGDVRALAVSGGDVYVGGLFTTAGGMAVNYLAKWDGSAWSALGSGMNGAVVALAASGGVLYAGGSFTTAGGAMATRIAKWNGAAWSALGSGMNSTVWALAADGSELYAGGDFTTAGGVSANRIAKWSGSVWSPLGSGVSGTFFPRVFALTVRSSELFAGGVFSTAGGLPAQSIAKWDGSAWSALGSGTGSTVQALAADASNRLFIGGFFYFAGTTLSPYIVQANLPVGLAAVTSPASTSITNTVATLSGNVTSDGGAPITERGVIYSATATNNDPLIGAPGVTKLMSSGTTGIFAVNAGGLTPSSGYSFKAYAVNAAGTAYSAVATFSTFSALQHWRQIYFGSTANSGNAADTADFDRDGIVNVMEYAFGLNPTSAASLVIPQPQRIGNNLVISFNQPMGVSGVTYGAESSSTLASGGWSPVPDSGSGATHTFSVPIGSNTKLFLRLTVTVP